MNNPYGAVTDALNNMGTSLSELAKNHLANKVAEGNLQLQAAKADTENKMIGAGIVRDQLASEREAQRTIQQGEQFGMGQAQARLLSGNEIASRETINTAHMKELAADRTSRDTIAGNLNTIAKGRLKIEQDENARAATAANRLEQLDTYANRFTELGAHPKLAEILGVNPTAKITERKWQEFKQMHADRFKDIPGERVVLEIKDLELKTGDILDKLAKSKDPAERAKLTAQKDEMMETLTHAHQAFLSDTGLTPTEMTKSANTDWLKIQGSHNEELKAKYPTLESYAPDHVAGIKKIRESVIDFKALKNRAMKIAVSPNYDAEIPQAMQNATKGMTKEKAEAFTGKIGKLEDAGKYAEAFNILEGYIAPGAKVKEGTAPKAPTNPSAGAPPLSPPVTTPQQRASNLREAARVKQAQAKPQWAIDLREAARVKQAEAEAEIKKNADEWETLRAATEAKQAQDLADRKKKADDYNTFVRDEYQKTNKGTPYK